MYQGKYVAPVWVNNQAPAINDAELLAISQTLEDSQTLTGNSAPTVNTEGEEGQLFVVPGTGGSPAVWYRLRIAADGANQWELDDPNGNIAETYVSGGAYAEGDYCIHGGILYQANTDIPSPGEAFNPAHWTEVNLADVIAAIAGNVDAKANPPGVGTMSLSASWTGTESPYTQTATVTGATVTANSKIDIQLTAAQISDLISDGVQGMVVENNAGTLTVYAVGAAPSAAMTVQVTVTETA